MFPFGHEIYVWLLNPLVEFFTSVPPRFLISYRSYWLPMCSKVIDYYTEAQEEDRIKNEGR